MADYRYLTEQAQSQNRLNDATLNQQYQTNRIESEFGFGADHANNPYTRASLLQRRANQRFKATGNTMAARGQLYAGSMDRARSADAFTSGQETDEARKSYADALYGVQQEGLGAYRTHQEGAGNAYADYIDRLIQRQREQANQ